MMGQKLLREKGALTQSTYDLTLKRFWGVHKLALKYWSVDDLKAAAAEWKPKNYELPLALVLTDWTAKLTRAGIPLLNPAEPPPTPHPVQAPPRATLPAPRLHLTEDAPRTVEEVRPSLPPTPEPVVAPEVKPDEVKAEVSAPPVPTPQEATPNKKKGVKAKQKEAGAILDDSMRGDPTEAGLRLEALKGFIDSLKKIYTPGALSWLKRARPNHYRTLATGERDIEQEVLEGTPLSVKLSVDAQLVAWRKALHQFDEAHPVLKCQQCLIEGRGLIVNKGGYDLCLWCRLAQVEYESLTQLGTVDPTQGETNHEPREDKPGPSAGQERAGA